MSTLTQHPAYAQVEDLLDSVGQRYRVFLLLRGAILFLAFAVILLVPAALLASILGPGLLTRSIAIVTLLALAAALLYWVGRPLIFRPRNLAVARMIEQRVPNTHNGLTNLVLLAHADDLSANPWMDDIFREIASGVSQRPLASAVRFYDLRKPALIAWGIALPILILGVLFSTRIVHGASQIARPSQFVPIQGAVELIEVLPGNATVIKGRPFEITAIAKGPGEFAANVIFEDQPQPAAMASTVDPEGRRRFTFVRDHIDENTRYRINAGGTESAWFSITAIRQVSLVSLSATITPPAYTRAQPQNLQLAPADLARQPIMALQGSIVKLAFDIDVPVSSGMLQMGEGTSDSAPIAATVQMDGKRFSAELPLRETTPASMLLIDAAGQIIARLPEQPLLLQATPDQGPGVELKWPQFDTSIAPAKELRIEARLRDDYALTAARLLWSASQDEPMQIASERTFSDRPATSEFAATLPIPADLAKHGKSIWVQVEAVDNRDLLSLAADLGPQTTTSKRIEIRFRDPQQLAKEQSERSNKLREQLTAMLTKQRTLHSETQSQIANRKSQIPSVLIGQSDLRASMLHTADTYEFSAEDRLIQKTLQVLAGGAAQEAIDYAKAAIAETQAPAQETAVTELRTRQRRVIQTLESLLAMLNAQAQLNDPAAQKRAGDLDSPAEEFKQLTDALQQFIKEEQRILDQTSALAKKPVDNFDENDKKLLEELKQAQEKLDAFMQQKVSDFSNMAEQDMANASMLRELLEVYTEVTMAKGALNEQMVEMAISHEEMGIELASEITSNLEKWLLENPDRLKWTQEDQLERTEAPMAELPTELEDMIGELMEEQEDLFEDIEDANANWHDSLDKGAGWDAMDGPIDNMSAKGVTGNTLPNNNEMGGRAGEGRSGKSQGEMVEETATGKGGRNTPTRLDPTAFQRGQIKDTSDDPVGGATGGGKLSGQGGAGLEGPVAPNIKQEMDRLKQRQAELRNGAERLSLQYQLGSYDNFKMLEAVAIMRRLESDLNSNRYQNALRRKDILLDAMDNSRTLIGGEISIQHDTTPTGNRKMQREINDAMKGSLPPAWENALKQYYRKLGQE